MYPDSRPPGGPRSTSDLRDRARSLRQHLPERRQSSPPPEHGRRLATIPRPKDDEEIRINWCEYEGHPYLSIRFWCRADDGQFWPDKHRGFSIRIRELPDVAAAIAEAVDLAEEHLGSRPQQQPQRQVGADRRHWNPSTLPGAEASGPGFDEFAEGGVQ
jgi:hypothetical protein